MTPIFKKFCHRLTLTIAFVALFFTPQYLAAQTACAGVGGKVFSDFNFNGINDETSTVGVDGVKVYLYAADGTADSTLTSGGGKYNFAAATAGKPYRIEIKIPTSLNTYQLTSSAIQFGTAPLCSVNFGVAINADYCQANPYVIIPCYVNGDPTNANGSAKDSVALVAVPFLEPNAGPHADLLPVAKAGQIGSVWGVAYDKKNKSIITTSVLKRHVGLGTAGPGGIYFLNFANPATPSVLGSMSLAAGTDPRVQFGEILPGNPTLPSYDTAAFSRIGKMGLGGVAVSDDGNTLYTMNLASRKLFKINLLAYNTSGTIPTLSDILDSIPMPSPCGTSGTFRPWAVKFYHGKVYIGGVCDAQNSQDTTDLGAYVYELSGTSFNLVYNFSLNYKRGYASSFDPSQNRWLPWRDTYQYEPKYGSMLRGDEQFIYPQPILSDIEFDVDGSMILGFMDRMGNQGGFKNYVPVQNFSFINAITIAAGDIVRVNKNGGTFQLEGTPSVNGTTAGGLNNGQGPNGSEYYWSDFHRFKLAYITQPVGVPHEEITTGGLAFVPGSGQVISTLYAPLNEAQSAGITWFDNPTGFRSKSFEIYQHDASNVGFFGKGNGLGDATVTCQAAPVQIGNRVWADCNGNGTQDADEKGIPNVKVSLLNTDCQVIDTKNTDADGNYAFTNLNPLSTYFIQFGSAGDFVGNIFTVNGVPFTLSPTNGGEGVLKNENNSDATLNNGTTSPQCLIGKPHIVVKTGEMGSTDFSFDMGLVGPTLTISSVVVMDESCQGANNGKITITATINRGQLEYSIDSGKTFVSTFVFNNLLPKKYGVIVQIKGGGAGVCGNNQQTVEVRAGKKIIAPVTTNDNTCQFNLNSIKGGLTATCEVCPDNLTPKITWWTAATGGVKVFEGALLNPIALTGAGKVDVSVVGSTTFYAQCECATCFSDRTPSVFTVNPQPDPIISGKTLVCPSEEATYSTPFVANSSWIWTLPAGGVIVQNNGNSVKIRWNATSGGGPYKLSVKETNIFGCPKTVDYFISTRTVIIACVKDLNVILDNSCQVSLIPAMFLQGNYNGIADFKVQLLSGNVLLEEGIGSVVADGISINGGTYPLIGKTYTYKVIEPCKDNFCSGNVTILDRSAPTIQCPDDITLGCAQVRGNSTILPQDSGTPRITDCSPTDYTYSDQVFDAPSCVSPFTSLPSGVPVGHPLPTSGDIVKIIVRTFTAVDFYNNGTSCQQVIFVKKAKIENVVCPSDLEFECKNVSGALTLLQTGTPLLDIDGDLTTVYDRFPVNQSSCQITTTYKDDTFRLCAGSYKILRTWTILDWCSVDNLNTIQDERRKTCTQIIKVLDKTPPSVSAQFSQFFVLNNDLAAKDTTVNFDGFNIQNGGSSAGTIADIYPLGTPNACGGKFRMTLRADDWNCTMGKVTFAISDNRVKLIAGYPQFNAANQLTTAIFEGNFSNIGDYTFTITASDECGLAVSTKIFRVHVRDNIKPNVVCISQTTATLGSQGSVRIQANSFDNGSSDNCGIDRIEVRRMENCQDPSDILFKQFVDFYCCDAGKNIMVTMRVYDQLGNFSDCMVSVFVDDKYKPTCIAPAPTTVGCKDLDFANLSLYGEPSLWDNCGIKDTIYTYSKNLDNCGIGTITRKWVVSDFTGKKDSCSQIITVRGKSDFTVDFPDDILTDCFATVPSPAQVKAMMLNNPSTKDGHIINNGCGVLAVEVKDDTLTSVPGACYVILRKISVIDWCKYNPNNNAVDQNANCFGQPVCGDVHGNAQWFFQNQPAWQNLVRPACTNPSERRFRDADGLTGVSNNPTNPISPYSFSDGIICFTQIIKINDNTPPQFTSCPVDTIFKDGSNGCAGIAKVTATAQDQCNGTRLGDEGLTFKWFLVYKTSKTDSITIRGVGNQLYETVNGVWREGVSLPYNQEATVYWTVFDRCNNFTSCSQKIKVVDGKGPSVICQNKNAELAGSNGTAMDVVQISDILTAFSDNCTSTAYLNSKGILVRASDNPTNKYPTIAQTTVTMTCADANKSVPLQIWTIDEAGNPNYCTALVNVQDNLNACSVATLSAIVGATKTETDKPVSNVLISNVNNGNTLSSMTTTTNGNFSFNDLTKGNNYILKAKRNDSPANGVSTFDIALISKHLLDVQLITSPYKLIAADVNRDGEVSGADMLLIRNLILRKSTAFPNNTSWRFVDKSYVFKNPTDPFSEDFPETVAVNNLAQSATANFVGIKVGDVNGTAISNSVLPLSAQVRSAKSLTFEVDDVEMQAGVEYSVTFKASDFKAQGYQFTLNHTEGVTISKIEMGNLPTMTEQNFAKFKNAVTTSWNGNFAEKQANAFTFVLKSNKNARLSDVLSIGSNLTQAEAYDKYGELMNIDLRFIGTLKTANTEGGNFALFQNEPNPFADNTKISFNLPSESSAKITVYDAAGRILKVIEKQGKSGYNEVQFDKETASGILYYRLDTPTHSATKKMIILN